MFYCNCLLINIYLYSKGYQIQVLETTHIHRTASYDSEPCIGLRRLKKKKSRKKNEEKKINLTIFQRASVQNNCNYKGQKNTRKC